MKSMHLSKIPTGLEIVVRAGHGLSPFGALVIQYDIQASALSPIDCFTTAIASKSQQNKSFSRKLVSQAASFRFCFKLDFEVSRFSSVIANLLRKLMFSAA